MVFRLTYYFSIATAASNLLAAGYRFIASLTESRQQWAMLINLHF